MAEHKFRAFLGSHQWSDNLLDFVDFAKDPDRDPELPDPTSWEELKSHLVRPNAPRHAIDSAEHIWGLYVDERGGAG